MKINHILLYTQCFITQSVRIMLLRFVKPWIPRIQCRQLFYYIRSPNKPISTSFSLFYSAARETMLLTFSMVGHVPAWRMLRFICVFYWTRWLTLSLTNATSVTTETRRAWLIQRGWLKGPDASQQTGINRWIAIQASDPLSRNKVPAMCSFVILWPFNDIPFKLMKLFTNWFWNELMQTALFVQMVNCLSGVKVTSVVVGSLIYAHTGQNMQLFNTHTQYY